MAQQPQQTATSLLLSSTPWWRRRGTIIGFIVVVLLIILGAVLVPLINRRSPVTYQTQPIKQNDLSMTIGATGPVQSSVYNLTFSGTGATSTTIQEIDVKVGQTVKQGDQLAIVDKTALQDAYNQQLAVVLAAENNLASAQNSLGATQNVGNTSVVAAQTALASDRKALQDARSLAQATINLDQTTLNNDRKALDETRKLVSKSDDAARAKNQADRNVCNDPTKTLPSDAENCIDLADATLEQTLQTDQQTLQKAEAAVSADQRKLNVDRASGNASIQAAQAKVNADQAALNSALAEANSSNTTSQTSVTTEQGLVNEALAQLAADQHDLDNATLLAPHDGIVTVINGNVGGLPGVPTNVSSANTTTPPSTSTTTPGTFIQLVDTQALQVQANVNETDMANLQVGEPVTFTVNAFNGRTFTGTVSAIAPNGQTVSNVVTYPVTIDVDPKSLNGARILANMTANVNITVIHHTSVLLIPVDAVNFARLAAQQGLVDRQAVSNAMRQARQTLTTLEGKNPNIVTESPIPTFVLERDKDQFVVKPVVLGLTDGTQYEVLNGLSTKDKVVTGTGNHAG